jgi:hypothetical protein
MMRDTEGVIVETANVFDFGVDIFGLPELLGIMGEVDHEADAFMKPIWGRIGEGRAGRQLLSEADG